MRPNPAANALMLALMLAAPLAWGKSSDRNQDMVIEAGYQDTDGKPNGRITWSQGVTITQGTLSVSADAGHMQMRGNNPSQAVLTGKPVKLRQQQDDGTWMDAHAERIEYNLDNEEITLIGNYTLSSPKGSSSGQRMVYNARTGIMQAGGDGSRVRTVIKPRSQQPQNDAGKP